MEACLIVTYRCNAKCYMCNTWQHPSKKSEEFTPDLVDKLPDGLKFINITGGEPFIREDLDEIMAISDRIAVICEGEIMGIVPGNEATPEKLGLMMAGVVPEEY